MYTLSYQKPRPTGILGFFGSRLTPGTFGAAATLMLALGATQMVPWQADQAASTGLAQLLQNGNTPRTLAMAHRAAPAAPIATPIAAPAVQAPVEAPVVAAATPATPIEAAPAAPSAPSVENHVISLDRGQTLAAMLQEFGMVAEEAKAAVAAVRDVVDLRRIKAGQEFNVTIRRDGQSRNLLGLSFLADPTKEIKVARDNQGSFDANSVKVPTSNKRIAVSGEIRSSLYAAAQTSDVPTNVVKDMMKMFAYTVDFQRDIHPGDKFRIYYNQDVTSNGDKVGDGEIVYAAIESAGDMKELFRYEYSKGQFDYFDETGKSIRRGLLRTPIDNPHVTSTFGMRMHPILGFSKMHTGIDFGAPVGTPIYAAGEGTVEQAGWFGDYGRYVRIRHNNQISTAYAHTSSLADGIRPGAKVKQGQVIAYVGTTGRSTGPHLHYEMLMNGKKVNPTGVNIDSGRSLTGRQLTTFKAWRQKLEADFVASANPSKQELAKLASATTTQADKN